MKRLFETAPRRALLSFIAGAILAPAMPPWGFWPALLPAFGLMYRAWSSAQSVRGAFLYGWLSGLGFFLPGLYWIGNALLVGGNEDYVWAWPLAVAGLPALLALFPAAGAALFSAAARGRTDRFDGLLAFALCFTGAEWLRGHMFTGFPWNLPGYAWADVLPVAQLAAIGGIYLLTFLTVTWAALPGFAAGWRQPPRVKMLAMALAAAALAASWTWGTLRLNSHPAVLNEDIAVRLVQPNIRQEAKWDPRHRQQNLDRLLSLSLASPVNAHMKTLIVWPETAITDRDLEDPAARDALAATLSSYKAPVFLATGLLRGQDGHYFNSAAVFDRDLERLAVYDKTRLVPFGEYIPFQKWIPIPTVTSFEGFNAGHGAVASKIPGLGSFVFYVCYEIIFPGFLPPPDVPRPDAIVTITNDAWYGDSAGPRQHFAMAVFRAIETGLPVIRAANTGISGVIDPLGRPVFRTGLMETRGSDVALPVKAARPLYAGYGNIPFAAAFTIATLLSAVLRLRRQ